MTLSTLLIFRPQEKCEEKKENKRRWMRENKIEEKGNGSFSLNHQLPRLLLAERKREKGRMCLPEAFVLLPRLWGK